MTGLPDILAAEIVNNWHNAKHTLVHTSMTPEKEEPTLFDTAEFRSGADKILLGAVVPIHADIFVELNGYGGIIKVLRGHGSNTWWQYPVIKSQAVKDYAPYRIVFKESVDYGRCPWFHSETKEFDRLPEKPVPTSQQILDQISQFEQKLLQSEISPDNYVQDISSVFEMRRYVKRGEPISSFYSSTHNHGEYPLGFCNSYLLKDYLECPHNMEGYWIGKFMTWDPSWNSLLKQQFITKKDVIKGKKGESHGCGYIVLGRLYCKGKAIVSPDDVKKTLLTKAEIKKALITKAASAHQPSCTNIPIHCHTNLIPKPLFRR